MLAIVGALGTSLCWGGSDFLGGLTTRRASVLFVVGLSQLAGLSAATLIVLVVLRPPWPGSGIVWPVLFAGSMDALASVALYKGLALGRMSVVASIAATASLFPFTLGLVQGERLTAVQILGAALAVVGVMLAASKPGAPEAPESTQVPSSRLEARAVIVRTGGPASLASAAMLEARVDSVEGGGAPAPVVPRPASARWPAERLAIALALLTAVCFGLALVGYDAAARYDPGWTMLGARAVSAGFMGFLLLARRPRLVPSKEALPGIVAVGLLVTAGWGLFAFASTQGYLSIVAVLSNTFPAVTAVLALALLRERLARRQLVGVVATLAGIALVAA